MCFILGEVRFFFSVQTISLRFSIFWVLIDEASLLKFVGQVSEKLILSGDLLIVGLNFLAELKHILDDPMLSHSKRLGLFIMLKHLLDFFVELGGAKFWVNFLNFHPLQRLSVLLERRLSSSLGPTRNLFIFNNIL